MMLHPMSGPCLLVLHPMYGPSLLVLHPLSGPCLLVLHPMSGPCLPGLHPMSGPCLLVLHPMSGPCLLDDNESCQKLSFRLNFKTFLSLRGIKISTHVTHLKTNDKYSYILANCQDKQNR